MFIQFYKNKIQFYNSFSLFDYICLFAISLKKLNNIVLNNFRLTYTTNLTGIKQTTALLISTAKTEN